MYAFSRLIFFNCIFCWASQSFTFECIFMYTFTFRLCLLTSDAAYTQSIFSPFIMNHRHKLKKLFYFGLFAIAINIKRAIKTCLNYLFLSFFFQFARNHMKKETYWMQFTSNNFEKQIVGIGFVSFTCLTFSFYLYWHLCTRSQSLLLLREIFSIFYLLIFVLIWIKYQQNFSTTTKFVCERSWKESERNAVIYKQLPIIDHYSI